ncbi:type II toxin-antitoxin system HicB family antitoxin [Candidatus Berkelbacteria bacterium]|nr:type II toxin-antitoxin system HicB family antitoxin [Candidatus Berkelbacteria bacterium]
MPAVKARVRRYTVFVEPETGGYVATVPALPGCVTQGESLDDALLQAKDAIEGYLAVLKADGDPIPSESPKRTITDVEVRV